MLNKLKRLSRFGGLMSLMLLLAACSEATPIAQNAPAANPTPATTVTATTAPALTTAAPATTPPSSSATIPPLATTPSITTLAPATRATANLKTPALTATPTPYIETVIDLPTPTIPPKIYGRDELIAQLKQRVQGKVEPLLLPTKLPADLKPHLGDNGYEVFYTDSSYKRQIHLIIALPNPYTGDPAAIDKRVNFHGTKADYYISDSKQPTSHRFLIWNEPGKEDTGYEVTDKVKVGYFMTADGLTDAEFWQVANSLTPLPLAKNEQVGLLPQSSFTTKGYLVETKEGIGIDGSGKTYIFAQGSIKKIVLENGQPGALADLKKDMVAVVVNAHVLPGQSPNSNIFKVEADQINIYGHR